MKRQQSSSLLTRLAEQPGACQFITTSIVTVGLALLQGQAARAQIIVTDNATADQPRELAGIWQFRNPNPPHQVLINLEGVRSGQRFTLNKLPDGQPDQLVFEGTVDSDSEASGRALDARNPDNPHWIQSKVVLRDAKHLVMEGNLVLMRATNSEAARVRQTRRLSQSPLPGTPFDLNGNWAFGDGFPVFVSQAGGLITFSMTANGSPFVFFKGRYANNPSIAGEHWTNQSRPQNMQWEARTLIVEGPDRIRDGGRTLSRRSAPKPHDVSCDPANRNHVTDYYAWLRGTQAASEKDYATARCWLTIASEWEFGPAQSLLAGLTLKGIGGVPPDKARAFELARKSAENGDPTGQYELASLYRTGTGTEPDEEKAQYWRNKGDQTKSVELWLGAQAGSIAGHSIGEILQQNMWILGGVDWNLDMTPNNNCFARQVGGNRPTTGCPN